MSWLGDALRRVRVRGLREGTVQRGRVEATEHDTKDSVERWQDYGFSAQPVDGHGLRINLAGAQFLLRLDRPAERPKLEAYEVTVWHKEGHSITLKAGGVVEVDCEVYRVKAPGGVEFDTPEVKMSGSATAAGTVTGQADVVAGDKSVLEHRHRDVQTGTDNSGTMV
ncbi:MAG: phage baseplate assembly protein [Comamonas sp.]